MSPENHVYTLADSDDAASTIVEGERFGRLIRLKPEYRERYIVLHEHTFPGVLEQIRASNVRNYSIFLREGLLFSFNEYVGDDYEADMEAMSENPTMQDWWTLTDPMQESLLPEGADEWWATMTELYHGGPKKRPSAETDRRAYVRRVPDDPTALGQAYDAAAADLDAAVAAASLQNYLVYHWKSRLYTYFEYAGDQFEADVEQFWDSEAVRALDDSLPEKGSSRSPMECVFYLV